MAIIKEIELQSGITVNYHRIVSVNNVTNKLSIIEVASYTSKLKREEEKIKLANNESMSIFINTEYFDVAYNETLNVISAYQYLKGLDKFENYIDD